MTLLRREGRRRIVVGVNDSSLRAGHRIVSAGSVTANCAAPVLSVLDRAFGIERVFLTTVHAFSNQLRLADVPAGLPVILDGSLGGDDLDRPEMARVELAVVGKALFGADDIAAQARALSRRAR